MRVSQVVELKISPGFNARKLRRLLGLTQQELANLAGVSAEEINWFEHHLPVNLDAKRRLLKELWLRKAIKIK